MAKHIYSAECGCNRCQREGARREGQSVAARMLENRYKAGRPGRVAREYWDAYESGRPMSDNDR